MNNWANKTVFMQHTYIFMYNIILSNFLFVSASEMDLATAIEETTVALNLFLNNHYTEAKARMQPWYYWFTCIYVLS